MEENVHTSVTAVMKWSYTQRNQELWSQQQQCKREKMGRGEEYPNFLGTVTFFYRIFLNSTCTLSNAVNLYKYGTVLQEA